MNDIFKHINLCEQAGSGVPKILSAVKEEKFKYPEIEEKNMIFILKFWNINKITDYDKATLEEKNILHYLLKHYQITNKEARESFNYSKKKVNSLFESLIEKEYIERVGLGRGTFYKLKLSEDEEKIKLLENINETFRKIKQNI